VLNSDDLAEEETVAVRKIHHFYYKPGTPADQSYEGYLLLFLDIRTTLFSAIGFSI